MAEQPIDDQHEHNREEQVRGGGKLPGEAKVAAAHPLKESYGATHRSGDHGPKAVAVDLPDSKKVRNPETPTRPKTPAR